VCMCVLRVYKCMCEYVRLGGAKYLVGIASNPKVSVGSLLFVCMCVCVRGWGIGLDVRPALYVYVCVR
jgi:hypothetical protein